MAKSKTSYTLQQQEFLNSVVNKIGKQIYSTTAYSNPLKRLKKGFIDNAKDIEEIYIARCVGSAYDPEGQGALDRKKPEVITRYHQDAQDMDYQVTVQDKQVRWGFHSKDGVNRIANEIMESMHTGAEYDEFNKVLALLTEMTNEPKKVVQVADVVDEATGKAFIKEVKKHINKMSRRSSEYAQVENHSRKEQLVLFLNEDWDVEINVEVLASAFNMSKAQLDDCVKILIPDLGNKTKAILMDERALQIYDLFYQVEPQRNAKGKFTNYFLSTEKMFCYSDLVNMCVFKTE